MSDTGVAAHAWREWRGDTHWAIQVVEGIGGTAAGILDGAWRHLRETSTRRFVELLEPVGGRLMERVDLTAGPNWMPVGRDREVRS